MRGCVIGEIPPFETLPQFLDLHPARGQICNFMRHHDSDNARTFEVLDGASAAGNKLLMKNALREYREIEDLPPGDKKFTFCGACAREELVYAGCRLRVACKIFCR